MDKETIVKTAVKYLLSVCDGAHSNDSFGFNKPDALFFRLYLIHN